MKLICNIKQSTKNIEGLADHYNSARLEIDLNSDRKHNIDKPLETMPFSLHKGKTFKNILKSAENGCSRHSTGMLPI